MSDDQGQNVWVLVLSCLLTNAACAPRGKRLSIFEPISLAVKG